MNIIGWIKKIIAANQSGQALIIVLILLLFVGIIVVPLMRFVSSGIKSGTVYENRTSALYAADAGVQDAIWQLNNPTANPSYIPSSTIPVGQTHTSGTSYPLSQVNGIVPTITISWYGNNTYQIISTTSGSSSPTTVTSYITAIQGTNVFSNAGAALGPGGMTINGMNNALNAQVTGPVYMAQGPLNFISAGSSKISGNVYAGGGVTGSGGSIDSGFTLQAPTGSPISVSVGHPTPTYGNQTFTAPTSQMNALQSRILTYTTSLSPAPPGAGPPWNQTGNPWTPNGTYPAAQTAQYGMNGSGNTVVFNGSVYISGDMNFGGFTYNIVFNGPVTIGGTLNVTSGDGTITFNSTLYAGNISVPSADVRMAFNGQVYVNNNFSYTGGSSAPVFVGTIYVGGNFTVGAGYTLTLPDALYIGGNLTLTNGATLQNSTALPNSTNKVIIVNGSISMSGGTFLGTSNQIPLIVDLSTNPINITMQNGATASAALYAPNAAVLLQDNASFTGSIVASSITLGNGYGSPSLHYVDLTNRSDLKQYTGGTGGVSGVVLKTYNIGNGSIVTTQTAAFNPTTGQVGTSINVTGTGWATSETIDHTTGVTVGGTSASNTLVVSNGNLTGTITVPSALSVGTYAIGITGSVSGTLTVSGAFTVNAGALDHFTISTITSPQKAGTVFNITTITAQDVNNNTVNSFVGTVTFGGTAGVTGTSTQFSSGVLSGAIVTPTVAGSNLTVTVNDGSSHTGTATIAIVNPGAVKAANSTISANPASITANGTSTSTITVTEEDAYGNALTSSGILPVLSTTGGTLSSVTDNLNGTYKATLTSSTTAGTVNITGKISGVAIGTPVSVSFTTVGFINVSSNINVTGGSYNGTAVGNNTKVLTITINNANGVNNTGNISYSIKNPLGSSITIKNVTVSCSTSGGTLSKLTTSTSGGALGSFNYSGSSSSGGTSTSNVQIGAGQTSAATNINVNIARLGGNNTFTVTITFTYQ